MTYINFVLQQIKTLGEEPKGTPIFVSDIVKALAREYDIDNAKAVAAVNTALKRIMDKNLYPCLRHYCRGVYFIARIHPIFGEMGINTIELTYRKYLANDNGYETDHWVLEQIGLTTQLPNKTVFATNNTKGNMKYDRDCGVYVRPAKTRITAENKRYLQLLDAMSCMERALITSHDPDGRLIWFINLYDLDVHNLLGYAQIFYDSVVTDHVKRIIERLEERGKNHE